jgi:hypothetical protein
MPRLPRQTYYLPHSAIFTSLRHSESFITKTTKLEYIATMTSADTLNELKLQTSFGLFAILNLLVTIAGLHKRQSVGVAFLRYVRSCFGDPPHKQSLNRAPYEDDEQNVGMFTIESISILLSKFLSIQS